MVSLDLDSVSPSLAGPSRPQDRVALDRMKKAFRKRQEARNRETTVTMVRDARGEFPLADGSVVIAAITSCTNTSNPAAMIGAGLVARNAVKRGLRVPLHVKTSLAPGSRVVTEYLESAGLMPYLEGLGFHLAGYGCTTCIGNSGPLPPAIHSAVVDWDLHVASVLSGNRNFEARIHQKIRENFLASPMLVVAYALAGTINRDLTTEPVGFSPDGEPVMLDDIWPDSEEIDAIVARHVKEEDFRNTYKVIFDGEIFWQTLPADPSTTYKWNAESTYLKRPPFLDASPTTEDIRDARALLFLGDSVTTDHISPAGEIPENYPAGRYLVEEKVPVAEFNSYGSRRGNHEVMLRGTFANIRIRNRLVHPDEGGFTLLFPEGRRTTVFEASTIYQTRKVPLVVLAGSEYGTGSSRDWAAKGTRLLGVQAVIAKSFERIHRSNLVGMGVLPLEFLEGEDADKLGLKGSETYHIEGISELAPRGMVTVRAVMETGEEVGFSARVRIDSVTEMDLFKAGGILPAVLGDLAT